MNTNHPTAPPPPAQRPGLLRAVFFLGRAVFVVVAAGSGAGATTTAGARAPADRVRLVRFTGAGGAAGAAAGPDRDSARGAASALERRGLVAAARFVVALLRARLGAASAGATGVDSV